MYVRGLMVKVAGKLIPRVTDSTITSQTPTCIAVYVTVTVVADCSAGLAKTVWQMVTVVTSVPLPRLVAVDITMVAPATGPAFGASEIIAAVHGNKQRQTTGNINMERARTRKDIESVISRRSGD